MGIRVPIPTRIGPCYPRCAPTYGQGGSGSRAHRLVSGLLGEDEVVVPNGLLNNLILYYAGNENPAVEPRLMDLHTNALHAADNNTVTSNPGLVYPTARQYTLATSEYHSHVDNVLLRGGAEFTLACWIRFDSLPASQQYIMSKYETVGNHREYGLYYDNTSNRFEFLISYTGIAQVVPAVVANTFGAVAINTWYLVMAWYDDALDTIYIQINDTAADSAALIVGTINKDVSPFHIGALGRAAAGLYVDGRIGPSMMWKSAAGAGGVLTAAQRTSLYNGGAGLPYASFTT